jgi:2-desacetyl-2-hydroxyethyl bacteriochlorophyllide A dehydrogenase
MQAAIFSGPHNISVEDYSLPKIKDNELLIKVGACGVCGTDFHIFEGDAPAKPPVILGHEYVGEIVDLASNIKNFKIGDRIAVNPNIHCGYCEYCRKGKINLCLNLKALGVTINGGFSQYSVVPLTQAFLLPVDFPFEIAAFAEPLSCCVHGLNQATVRLGNSVAIVGAGPIGLLMMQLFRLSGASKTYVIDIDENKRNIALELHADAAFNPQAGDFLESFIDQTNGGADVVIECVGSEQAAKTSLNIVRKGGTLVVFGLASPKAQLHIFLQQLFHKELTLKSSILNPNTFQNAVDLLVSGKIETKLFNPKLVPLKNDNINSLFSTKRDSSIIKYMVVPDN